jgi:serine protease Do
MTDRVRYIILIVIFVFLAVLSVYRLSSQGKIHLPFSLPQLTRVESVQNQNRVVVNEENAVIDAVDKASPSVVAIGVTNRLQFGLNPFSQQSPSPTNQTIGTGFVASAQQGIIITNRHVVSDTSLKYSVVTKDGKKLDISKIYRDPVLDLAIVKVSGNLAIKEIEMGDSSKLKVGQTVIAIGNALGEFSNTVTTGVVSGLGRRVTAGDQFGGDTEQLDNLIQTDAAINPGNSGGPLLNSAGQVIGVDVATTEGAQNIGFAIPINSVRSLIDQFNQTGTISRPFLGVQYIVVPKDKAILYDMPPGAYVQDIVSDGPADKAGIKSGDVITKINGQTIDSDTKLSDEIQKKKVGDTVSLEVWTDGKTRTLTVTLGENPNQ